MNVVKINQKNLYKISDFSTAYLEFDLDPTKGLFLMGPVGVGKTYTIKNFMKSLPNVGHELTPEKIEYEFITKGLAYLQELKRYPMLIDDVGQENSQLLVNYGNRICPFVSIINVRYEIFKNQDPYERFQTHLTTNLNDRELLAKYGERTVSRLVEMCNIVVIDGVDLRHETLFEQF